jgi:hypothetical protein
MDFSIVNCISTELLLLSASDTVGNSIVVIEVIIALGNIINGITNPSIIPYRLKDSDELRPYNPSILGISTLCIL